MLEHIYWTLLIGFIAGALTRAFFHKMNMGEIFSAMTLGLIGSVSFGWLGSVLRLYEYGDNKGLIASTIGAIFTLGIYAWRYKKIKSTS